MGREIDDRAVDLRDQHGKTHANEHEKPGSRAPPAAWMAESTLTVAIHHIHLPYLEGRLAEGC